jgi:hypothetical protein
MRRPVARLLGLRTDRWRVAIGFIGALAAICIAPATASAASATLTTRQFAEGRGVTSDFRYSAGVGETNEVTLSIESRGFGPAYVVRDAGAVISAGQGCSQVSSHGTASPPTSSVDLLDDWHTLTPRGAGQRGASPRNRSVRFQARERPVEGVVGRPDRFYARWQCGAGCLSDW